MQWKIGDALCAEVGPPGPNGSHDGSAVRLAAASKYLEARGIWYAVESLKILRRTAAAFPKERRRPFGWTFHQEAKNPDTLDAIVASLPKGASLSVDHIKDEVRRRNGAAPPDPDKRPRRGFAWLMVRFIAALKTQPKLARATVIAQLMHALGLVIEDLSGGAREAHRAAAALRLAPPAARGPVLDERACAAR